MLEKVRLLAGSSMVLPPLRDHSISESFALPLVIGGECHLLAAGSFVLPREKSAVGFLSQFGCIMSVPGAVKFFIPEALSWMSAKYSYLFLGFVK